MDGTAPGGRDAAKVDAIARKPGEFAFGSAWSAASIPATDGSKVTVRLDAYGLNG